MPKFKYDIKTCDLVVINKNDYLFRYKRLTPRQLIDDECFHVFDKNFDVTFISYKWFSWNLPEYSNEVYELISKCKTQFFWLDYCCLPQNYFPDDIYQAKVIEAHNLKFCEYLSPDGLIKRTNFETEVFKSGLNNMNYILLFSKIDINSLSFWRSWINFEISIKVWNLIGTMCLILTPCLSTIGLCFLLNMIIHADLDIRLLVFLYSVVPYCILLTVWGSLVVWKYIYLLAEVKLSQTEMKVLIYLPFSLFPILLTRAASGFDTLRCFVIFYRNAFWWILKIGKFMVFYNLAIIFNAIYTPILIFYCCHVDNQNEGCLYKCKDIRNEITSYLFKRAVTLMD